MPREVAEADNLNIFKSRLRYYRMNVCANIRLLEGVIFLYHETDIYIINFILCLNYFQEEIN